MLGDFEKAIKHMKKAAIGAPDNSQYVGWLGRAYRRQTDISNPLLAVFLRKKAQKAFERAVQLNPKSAEALSDLFNYYLETPAVLSGGYLES